MPWYCTATPLARHCCDASNTYCLGNVLVLYWSCTLLLHKDGYPTLLAAPYYCSVLELHYYCIGNTLVLYWYSNGKALALNGWWAGAAMLRHRHCALFVLVLQCYCAGTMWSLALHW